MADKIFLDLRKVKNYVINKAYPEEILCDKVKIQISVKHAKTFLLQLDTLSRRKKDVFYLKKSANSSSYMLFMRDWGTILKSKH